MLLFQVAIIDEDGYVEACSNVTTVAEAVRWFREHGINFDLVRLQPGDAYVYYRGDYK